MQPKKRQDLDNLLVLYHQKDKTVTISRRMQQQSDGGKIASEAFLSDPGDSGVCQLPPDLTACYTHPISVSSMDL